MRMRALAWASIVAGITLTIAAFVVAADKATSNPWPILVAGFCLTTVGIMLLMSRKRPRNG